MRKTILAASLPLAFVLPAAAQAKQPTPQHANQYQHAYRQVATKLGKRAPGRNIINDGLSSGKAAQDTDVVRSLTVLQAMLAPPPQPVAHASAQPTATPVAASSAPVATNSAPGG